MKNATIYGLVFFMVLVTLLGGTSCVRTPEQAGNKIERLLKRFPTAIDTTTKIKIDTIVKVVYLNKEVFDSLKVISAYKAIDSLINVLKQKGNCDTVIIEKIRGKIKDRCTIENLLKPYSFDTTGVHINLSAKGNKLHLDFKFTELEINKDTIKSPSIICPEVDLLNFKSFKKYGWILLVAIAIGFIIGIAVKH